VARCAVRGRTAGAVAAAPGNVNCGRVRQRVGWDPVNRHPATDSPSMQLLTAPGAGAHFSRIWR
jgi:hypothetical protein